MEETPFGRLVEGIHALMAQFYSGNLASETRWGMTRKAKQGGYPHAPLGYVNVREMIAGRQVPRIVADPTAPHSSPSRWSPARPGSGRCNGSPTNSPTAAIPTTAPAAGVEADHLAGPGEDPRQTRLPGIVTWSGVQHPGTHTTLVSPET